MKHIGKVLQFELGNYFKNKSYIVTTVILTVLLVVGLSVPTVIELVKGDESSKQENIKQEDLDGIAIYDAAGVIKDTVYIQTTYPDYNWKLLSSEEDVKAQVTEGKAVGGFIVKSPTEYSYIVNNNELYDSNQQMLSDILKYYYRTSYMKDKGIDSAGMEQVLNIAIVGNQVVLGKDSVRNYWYTYILVMGVYFIIIMYGQLIATSVTAEKSSRAIEVLVTSTKPTALIFGKVFAGVIASFLQVGIVLFGGIVSYHFNRGAWDGVLDSVFDIPMEVLIVFFLFLVIGFLFYSFVYGALGALVSKTEDIGKSIGPVNMVFLIGFFIAMFGMNIPDSMLVKVASYIPFTSVYCMVIRVAMGSVHLIEIIISLLILGATSVVSGVLGAKIYRMGTLHYGNPMKLSGVIKRVFKEKEL